MPPGANFMPPPMGAPDMPAPPMMGGPPGMYFLWKNFFLLQNNRHLCKFFCGTCLKIIVIKTWKCELKIDRWKKKRKKVTDIPGVFYSKTTILLMSKPYTFMEKKLIFLILYLLGFQPPAGNIPPPHYPPPGGMPPMGMPPAFPTPGGSK